MNEHYDTDTDEELDANEELDYDDEPEPPRSPWAVVALICGIIAVFSPLGRILGILGILAIVFGHIALYDIGRGVASGKSMARWGLGLGYAFLVLSFIINLADNF